MILEFPLAERELARAGRSWRTYGTRLAVAGGMALVLGFVWLSQAGNPSLRSPEQYGRLLAGLASVVQYAAALTVSASLVTSAITSEKEGRTLGLLLMADLGGRDIILSKFLSAYIQVQLLILSVLPLQAFAAFMGGIDVSAATVQTILLSIGAASICAAGIFASTVCSRESAATLLTTFLVAAGFLISVLPQLSMAIPPLNPFVAAFYYAVGSPAGVPWLPSAFVSLAVTILVLLAANLLLPAQAYDKPSKKRRPIPEVKRRKAVDSSGGGAISALAYSAAGGSALGHRGPFMRFLIMACVSAFSFVPIFGPLIVLSLVTRSALAMINTLRETGVLENIFVTPVTDRELPSQLIKAALIRTKAYLWAIVIGQAGLLIAFAFVDMNALVYLLICLLPLTFGLAAFWSALVFGCYGGTVEAKFHTQERVAGLWWLLLLVIAFAIPGVLALVVLTAPGVWLNVYVVLSVFAAWCIFTPIALGRFVFEAFGERIRVARMGGGQVVHFSESAAAAVRDHARS
jgi:hypothetical protein